MGLAVVTKTRAHLPHAFAHDPANVWEEQLHDIWIGATERARVGRIPNLLAKAIGARTTIVYLSKTNAARVKFGASIASLSFRNSVRSLRHSKKRLLHERVSYTLLFGFKAPFTKPVQSNP